MPIDVIEKEKLPSLKSFPKLMTSSDGCIVLAISAEGNDLTGTCLRKGNVDQVVGEYCEHWDRSCFYDLEGSILICNT